MADLGDAAAAVRHSVRPRYLADYHWPVPVTTIDDASDPRLADYRNIPDPDLARAHGLFVAEGRLVVGRLLESRFVVAGRPRADTTGAIGAGWASTVSATTFL